MGAAAASHVISPWDKTQCTQLQSCWTSGSQSIPSSTTSTYSQGPRILWRPKNVEAPSEYDRLPTQGREDQRGETRKRKNMCKHLIEANLKKLVIYQPLYWQYITKSTALFNLSQLSIDLWPTQREKHIQASKSWIAFKTVNHDVKQRYSKKKQNIPAYNN